MADFIQWLWSIDTLFLAIIILVSITLHEFAHAWMADRLGDPTPSSQWRVTINPLAHLDFLGFILIFIIWFGWGRPVLYNPAYLKDPIKDEAKIAFAWPIMNILLAILGILIMLVYGILVDPWQSLVSVFFMQFIYLNIALAVFNMIPLPPLDGYRLIQLFAPNTMRQVAQYGQYILIGFVLIFVFGPGSGVLFSFIHSVSQAIFQFLFMIVSAPFGLFL